MQPELSLLKKCNARRKLEVAYRGCEFGRLSRLSTLLSNWRQWSAERGDVVRSEAPVEVTAGIAGGRRHLGANSAQRTCEGSERCFFTGGFEGAAVSNAGGKSHFARNTLFAWNQHIVVQKHVECVGCSRR